LPDRYQREIEDILRRMGESPEPTKQKWSWHLSWRQVVKHIIVIRSMFLSIASPGNVLKVSLILLAASFVLRFMMPRFAVYVSSIAVVLLVVGVAGFVMSEHNPTTRGWRGRPLELPGDRLPRWQALWERWLQYWRQH
jgi:hypothetical protein